MVRGPRQLCLPIMCLVDDPCCGSGVNATMPTEILQAGLRTGWSPYRFFGNYDSEASAALVVKDVVSAIRRRVPSSPAAIRVGCVVEAAPAAVRRPLPSSPAAAIRVGCVVDAAPDAFGHAFAAAAAPGARFRGTVVARGEDDAEDDADGVAASRRVWRIKYADDGEVWSTAEEHLTLVRDAPPAKGARSKVLVSARAPWAVAAVSVSATLADARTDGLCGGSCPNCRLSHGPCQVFLKPTGLCVRIKRPRAPRRGGLRSAAPARPPASRCEDLSGPPSVLVPLPRVTCARCWKTRIIPSGRAIDDTSWTCSDAGDDWFGPNSTIRLSCRTPQCSEMTTRCHCHHLNKLRGITRTLPDGKVENYCGIVSFVRRLNGFGHVSVRAQVIAVMRAVEQGFPFMGSFFAWARSDCVYCAASTHPERMLLCDGCDAEAHYHCAGFAAVPEGDWFCDACVVNPKRRRVVEGGESRAPGEPRVAISPTAAEPGVPHPPAAAAPPGLGLAAPAPPPALLGTYPPHSAPPRPGPARLLRPLLLQKYRAKLA